MFGMKKKVAASQLSTPFINAVFEPEGHYEGFIETIKQTVDVIGGPAASFEKAIAEAAYPQMAYLGAVVSISMMAVPNLFPRSAADINRSIYETMRGMTSEKTAWFPDYVFGLLAEAQQEPEKSLDVIASRLVQRMNLHLEPAREKVMQNPLFMLGVQQCLIYHPATRFWKDISEQARVIS